jgi:hypothetical protein
MIRDQVVHVVAALPPSDGEATAKVGNEDADQGVDDKVLGDGAVTCVVGAEHDLMLGKLVLANELMAKEEASTYPEDAQEDS